MTLAFVPLHRPPLATAPLDRAGPGAGVSVRVFRAGPDLAPGVGTWRAVDVRVPARDVLADDIGSVASTPPAPTGRRSLRRRLAHPTTVVRTPDGPVEVSVVVVDDADALTPDLAAAVERTDDPGLQATLDAIARDPTGRDARRRIAHALERGGPDGDRSALCTRAAFEAAYDVDLELDGVASRTCGLEAPPWSTLVAEKTLDVRGHAVPRRVVVAPLGQDRPTLLHDGQALRALRRGQDLPDEVLAALDRNGRVEGGRLEALVPLAHLTVRLLLRVPPPDALAAALADAGRRRPPRRSLARPALVVDGRDPVPLTGREPVLDDPAAAAWVLCRVSRGVFLPGDEAPRRAPDPALLERPFLALCDAGLGA